MSKEMEFMIRTITLETPDLTLTANIAGAVEQPALLLLHGWPHSRVLYEQVLLPLSADFFVSRRICLALAPEPDRIGMSAGQRDFGDDAGPPVMLKTYDHQSAGWARA